MRRGMTASRGLAAFFLLTATSASPAFADGFGASRLWASGFSPAPETPLVGDFNGDLRDDAITFLGDSRWDWRRGDVMVALSTGTTLSPATKWHDFFAIGAEVPLVGDFNNDGRDDIALFKRSAAGDQAGDVIVALSNGTSFGAPQLWHPFFGLGDELPMVGDWNGDLRDDIAVFKRTSPGAQAGDVLVALSTGSSFGPSQLWHSDFAFGADVPVVGDFNADQADDIAVLRRSSTPGQEGRVLVALSSRTSFGPASIWHWFFGVGQEVPVVGDVNGDGRDDLAIFKRSTVGDVRMGDVVVARSNGYWFGTPEVWHDFFGIGDELPAFGDLDRDGRDDALIFKRTGSGSTATGYVLAAINAAPSVLEPDQRASAFGYDTMRAEDGARAQGTRPLLTILVDFSDVPMAPSHTAAFYRDLLFTGATDPHSVNGFFLENSFGQFSWSDAGVVGPFRAIDDPATAVDESQKACAKGGCMGSTSSETLVFTRAIQRAAASGVDFARFDTNRDGDVTVGELGIVIFNGSSSGDRGGTNNTFGVQVTVSGPSGTVRVVPRIASVAEYIDFATLTHELLHSIGAHDLYNSTNAMSANATIMNNLVASNAARPSVELDAWHKMALGWVMPRIYDLTQPGSCEFTQVSYADATLEASSYYERPILIYDPRRGGREYFLLEPRLRDAANNRYDADVLESGVAVWYVQQDANRNPAMIPGVKIEPRTGGLQTIPAPGSDDFINTSDGTVRFGPDEIWQSVPAGDDQFYMDRAVLQLGVGLPRGQTDLHSPADGRFRARYLIPWDDAELAIEVAPAGDPRWLAVRWGHHALDVLPTVGNNDLFQYCHDRFPR